MPPPARLLSAPWIVPVATPPVREGAVVVDACGDIVAVGARAELRASFPDLPEERATGVLMPGLVNAHAHLELSALGGAVPGGDGAVAWTRRLMEATGRVSHADKVRAAVAAARQSVEHGTAAIGDVGNSLAAVPAIAEAGLVGVFFHEVVGSREIATGDALADLACEREAFEVTRRWPARLGYVPAPHALYSVGASLARRIFAAAAEAGHPTSIHVAEDFDELQLLRDGSGGWRPVLEGMGVDPGTRAPGLGPLAYLETLGAFARGNVSPLLVHMVHASQDDRHMAARTRAPVVVCARSNLHISGRLPDVSGFMADGLELALGTDSLASCPDPSLWGEMATLATRFPAVPVEIWLRLATAGGARALGLPRLGALAPGMRPGVLEVQIEDRGNPLAALVRTEAPTLRWMVRA